MKEHFEFVEVSDSNLKDIVKHPAMLVIYRSWDDKEKPCLMMDLYVIFQNMTYCISDTIENIKWENEDRRIITADSFFLLSKMDGISQRKKNQILFDVIRAMMELNE